MISPIQTHQDKADPKDSLRLLESSKGDPAKSEERPEIQIRINNPESIKIKATTTQKKTIIIKEPPIPQIPERKSVRKMTLEEVPEKSGGSDLGMDVVDIEDIDVGIGKVESDDDMLENLF